VVSNLTNYQKINNWPTLLKTQGWLLTGLVMSMLHSKGEEVKPHLSSIWWFHFYTASLK
jgi:hypothetical protein